MTSLLRAACGPEYSRSFNVWLVDFEVSIPPHTPPEASEMLEGARAFPGESRSERHAYPGEASRPVAGTLA
jgi:hypothetical protein